MGSTVSAKIFQVAIITGFVTSGLLGCSSKGKSEAKASEAKPAAAAAATPSTETRTTPVSKAVKAVKKEAAKATAAATEASVGSTSCKSGSDQRSIEVKPAGEGCEVVYTKAGEAKTVASAVSDKGHCNNVAEKITNNLKTAGYSCE